MEIQTAVIITSAIINLVLILLYARSLYIAAALTALIATSPEICYECWVPRDNHILHETDVDNPHPFTSSHLVYVPDEHLR